jgi:hypothetical protein
MLLAIRLNQEYQLCQGHQCFLVILFDHFDQEIHSVRLVREIQAFREIPEVLMDQRVREILVVLAILVDLMDQYHLVVHWVLSVLADRLLPVVHLIHLVLADRCHLQNLVLQDYLWIQLDLDHL